MSIRIAQLSLQTVPGAVALQRACFPPPFPAELLWSNDHLERHFETFPAGQFVALADKQVIGSASALIISEENWLSHRGWEATTGGHFMGNHDPNGTTLYGMDISVHPDFRGKGVGRLLYQARFDLVARNGLTRYGTACRIPGLAAWSSSNGADAEAYCQSVVSGEAIDRTMTPLLRYGLRYLQVLENYMEDEESCNCAALLEWTP